MPLPLLWLGVAAASAIAVKGLADDRKAQQRQRLQYRSAKTLSDLKAHEPKIASYPTELLITEQGVQPCVGAIVCCGIGGVLEHTGIWIGDNTIVEVDGNGLVKAVSAQRFTKHRSGEKIFIACDSLAQPLASEKAAELAIAQIYQVRDYHLFDNNCHQFVWQCFHVDSQTITTFKALSNNIAHLFDRVVYWDNCDY
ncbi:hypothetical protein SAMN05216262_10570 [Colwellia chukchiensis]|uniref:Lecithin retinol acyltransferase n=1 Tax=Colwellia chukchiensis TaxID=641665 RepID=A0A1H7M360_9GAMM|nr:hypothetical protein [Colwellia chukchiensis]SEL05529.1 hypothetical protein SAMN05216262_10570 [Colwellia chukchiensis]